MKEHPNTKIIVVDLRKLFVHILVPVVMSSARNRPRGAVPKALVLKVIGELHSVSRNILFTKKNTPVYASKEMQINMFFDTYFKYFLNNLFFRPIVSYRLLLE